jgi:hypothetical protein
MNSIAQPGVGANRRKRRALSTLAQLIVMHKINKLKYIILALVVVGTIYAFLPSVEEVEYTEHFDRFKNSLIIMVNTKSGLFKGRESFLNFNRDEYSFYFLSKGKTYTEKDIMNLYVSGTTELDIIPQQAFVKIEDNQPDGIVVTVDVKDKRISKLINGRYVLRVADSNPNHIWYKLK